MIKLQIKMQRELYCKIITYKSGITIGRERMKISNFEINFDGEREKGRK